jgi:hypothetical protein
MYLNEPAPQVAEEMAVRMIAALPPDEFPHLREAWMCWNDDFESDFDFGLRALIRGLIAEGKVAEH